MEKRFFLNGIDMTGDSFTINQGVKLPILILTNSTDSSFSWKARLDSPKARQDGTIVGTVLALDCSVF